MSFAARVGCWIAALALILPPLVPLTPPQSQRPYAAARHGGNYMHNYYLPPAPSSTPWAPAWSPDGEWIAVGMAGSIWRIAPATGVAEELTYNDRYHSSPDFSPDGRWIIYTADDANRRIQLEIVDLESGEIHELTDDDGIYLDPVFSPEGTRVAYVSSQPNGYFNVYVRAIRDGRWAGEPVAVTRDNNYGANRLYFGAWDMAITPTWLPSGDELLLVSNRDVPLGSGNVLRVPAYADGIDEAVTVLAEQSLYRARPDVSIDGKRFVYSSSSGTADQFNNLYVLPTDGGEPYKMTFFQHDAFHPRFSPDGEWIAYVDNAGGLPQLALLETYGGARRTVEITDRRWKRPMGTLTVQTRESRANAPIAARVHLRAADGKFYAPTDTYARVSGQGDHVFHSAGSFTVELPEGPAELVIVKGFEFLPHRFEIDIEAGRRDTVVVAVERFADMGAEGWYSGSTHVHMNYAGNLHNTLENLMMMSAAEDQDVVAEQIANKDNRILDYQFFVPGGGPHPLSQPDRLLVVGQEYRPPFYGHVFMFGMRDHLISPFVTGYEGTAIESLYPSNTDMFRKAKEQGATVGYVHAFGGSGDPLEGNLGGAKGFMVDAALGTTDALEWSGAGTAGFYPLYAAWSNGLKVTGVGGEDSISNLHRSKLVGSVRTYVYTGDAGLDMDAWFEGLREGRAFMSTGPLVEFTVNGRMPGETVELPAGGGQLEIEGRIRTFTTLADIELIHDGEHAFFERAPPASAAGRTATGGFTVDTVGIRATINATESGWIHLRVAGDHAERYPLDAAYAQAFTNPVWISVGGEPPRDLAAAEYGIAWIDKLRAMAEEWPGWRSDVEKAHVFAQFDEARVVYERFADEARR